MDSWLRSFRPSWFAGVLPYDMYYPAYRQVIERVMARPGAQTVVACPQGDDDTILGFACAEPPGLVFYAYTKDVYRRNGVARKMLESIGIKEPFEYSFRTREGANALTGKNAQFNPFRVRDKVVDK